MTKSRYLKEKKGVEVTDISDDGHLNFGIPRATIYTQWRYMLDKVTEDDRVELPRG